MTHKIYHKLIQIPVMEWKNDTEKILISNYLCLRCFKTFLPDYSSIRDYPIPTITGIIDRSQFLQYEENRECNRKENITSIKKLKQFIKLLLKSFFQNDKLLNCVNSEECCTTLSFLSIIEKIDKNKEWREELVRLMENNLQIKLFCCICYRKAIKENKSIEERLINWKWYSEKSKII